ncbi:MAG TPA: N-6 DNA methylase, partial [Candidatus Dojkabacteria bacterium]|nr:N-6 DNA methylase [Candidatus Dojkabacteria bacterium]
MEQIFEEYLTSISKKYAHEETSEYGYRTDFEILLNKIFDDVKVQKFNKRIDHDAKTIDGNKPDFVLFNGEIPLLYIEAKDIGVSLDKIENSDQMRRYFGYANLVLTDYLEFRFYRNGIRYEDPIKIAEYNKKSRTITPIPENYEHVKQTLVEFTQSYKEPIKSGSHLSKIMAGKAQRIRDNVKEYLKEGTEIAKVYDMLKKLLVNDLSWNSFADMYAQTLVYGLFTARYNDETPDNFTRQEARDLIPQSNPLLRHFFDHIVGPDFDKRLEYIVNELCDVFSHADVKKILDDYYEKREGKDPLIHFYEDFLQEYDPELRKRMGAYYTPLPVVNFIVNSVDTILKKDFNLPKGLADGSKYPNGKHIVQVLDPATGTGTFISAVIDKIYESFKPGSGQEGRWPTYVYHDLLPRIHAFELMMTPYTIAHLRISLTLKERKFIHFNSGRLGIYLTNALEEGIKQEDLFSFGFAESITEESKEADKIKKNTPIMVVLGNPPYSVSSSNKGEWIQELIKVYKQDLNEKKINLDDDYIKFIRLAESYIEKNQTGIVAMITNNSFIDGITHRQMRKHLLETFDDIYILNLHGNSKKKEVSPDGTKDENVINIMQGVSINIFVRKNKEKKGLGKVHHRDLYGNREMKFQYLENNNIGKIKWDILDYKDPYYFFVPKDFSSEGVYSKGFELVKLCKVNGSGIQTGKDSFFYDFDPDVLLNRQKSPDSNKLTRATYRPFDQRFLYYDTKAISRPRAELMQNFFHHDNLALLVTRHISTNNFRHVFLSNTLSDRDPLSLTTQERSYIFPLYLYSDDGSKTPNFNNEIVSKIEEIVGKTTPGDILDYIYAVLH